MITTINETLTALLNAWLMKSILMTIFFMAGTGTAFLPESVVTILPKIKGHVYKRIAFILGMSVSVILVGVYSSWFLGPTFLGMWSYILWPLVLILMALYSLELVGFIHPQVKVPNTKIPKHLSGGKRIAYLASQGILAGMTWGPDRLPIYIWLVVSIAMVGWKLASLLIISFIVGNMLVVFWTTTRTERVAHIVTRPYYRKYIVLFKRFMAVIMIAEAMYMASFILGN